MATLRRTAPVNPIAALRTEYWPLSRNVQVEILPAYRKLDAAMASHSPLGRGSLSGLLRDPSELDPADWRRANPRFRGEHLQANVALARQLWHGLNIVPTAFQQGSANVPLSTTASRH